MHEEEVSSSYKPTLLSTSGEGNKALPPTIIDTLSDIPIQQASFAQNVNSYSLLISIIIPIFVVCVITFIFSLVMVRTMSARYSQSMTNAKSKAYSSDFTSETGDILNTFDYFDNSVQRNNRNGIILLGQMASTEDEESGRSSSISSDFILRPIQFRSKFR